MLRIVVACALLGLSSAPSSAQPRVWTDGVEIVVKAPTGQRADDKRQRQASLQQGSHGARKPAAVDAPLRQCDETTSHLVLIGKRYLNNRTLLC